MSQKEDFSRLAELIEDIRFAMLCTRTSGDRIDARPMTTQEILDEDDVLYFVTGTQQSLTDQIQADPRVTLIYSNPDDGAYVVVQGEAKVTRNEGRIDRYWNPLFGTWFEGKDDPRLRTLEVRPHAAEFWASTGTATTVMARLKKAVGAEPEVGEHDTLRP